MPEKKPETIVINNFGGRLTRILNGDLNSGFAKFRSSFGYDPFTKPMNLTWLGQPSSIAAVSDVVVAGINRDYTAVNLQTVFAVGSNSKIYKILVNNTTLDNPNVDSVIGIASLSGVYNQGTGMQFFGVNEKLYVSSSNNIVVTGSVLLGGINNSFELNGQSSIIANSSYMAGSLHPLAKFAGKLIFGNGPSIGAVDSSGIVISSVFTVNNYLGNQYSQLFPPLPMDQTVRDLDVTPDGNYLQMSATDVTNDLYFFPAFDGEGAVLGQGAIFGWNGIDQGVTTALTIPGGNAPALQTYLQNYMFFLNDTFGAAVSDGTRKILTLPGNKVPVPNATTVNGNFLSWMAPEVTGTKRVASLYYFGSLDEENPVGLYRLLRYETTLANGFVFQVPYNALVTGNYQSLNVSRTSVVTQGVGKHYFSTFNVSSTVGIDTTTPGAFSFNKFIVSSTNNDPPQLGVYETQTQLFSKRVQLSQIRVYTEPTIAGNGFQIDVIGSDGAVIENGTFSYVFTAGIDETKLEGALQRINFNPDMDTGYAFGIRITNTGTTNMTTKKVEIDWTPSGK